MPIKFFRLAVSDVFMALHRIHLALTFGWLDVKQRYRRSMVGPFWLTISMSVMIGTIGLVFGQIFKSPMNDYLPYLTVGMVLWSLVVSCLTEGCLAFIQAEGIIKQIQVPFFSHVMRVLIRNLIVFLHNIVILPMVFYFVGRSLSWQSMVAVIGLFVLVLNLSWMSLLLGLLSARFRDLPQIINSAIQVIFYLTPIIWLPSLLPERAGFYLLSLNPMYHLFEIVRAPLLGQLPSSLNWMATSLMAVVGWVFTLFVFGRFRNRIAYWL